MTSNYHHLVAAARRENWATRLWWAFLALATAILLALLLRHIGISAEYVIAAFILWTAAWLAPWTAMLSLRRRASAPPPADGSTDLAAWKDYARALCSRLDWALRVLKDHEARARVRTAHAALYKAFRSHPTPSSLQNACAQVTGVTLPDLRRALWLQLIPEVMPIANDAYARAAASPDAARAIRLDAMRDATALAVLRLHPHLLMADLVNATHQCLFAAVAFAAPNDPIIPLAAAIAIDWGNPAIPWHPLSARRTALATIRSIDPQASLKYHEPFAPLRVPDDEVPAAPQPKPQPSPAAAPAHQTAAAPSPAAPARRRRHHHHHHHHHHHRSSLRFILSPIRDISRIFGSFFQRIHYLIKSAFLYR
jgi:hypothetical protein